jgi:hypothetical protein
MSQRYRESPHVRTGSKHGWFTTFSEGLFVDIRASGVEGKHLSDGLIPKCIFPTF